MTESAVFIPPSDLTGFACRLFEAARVDAAEATVVAESLVDSNLCGHDSHGVMRVVEYVGQLRGGELIAGAELKIRNETASLIVADAGLGFGQVQCRRLIERLLPKAREDGVACGTMTRCGHVGRLGEWVERTAREGVAGLITVNDNGVLQCVAPPGGTQPRISTNPLAVGIPTGGEPFVMDISTSAVANGKVRVALLAGQPCPEGWLLDSEGNPTTDPAVRCSNPPGTLLPMDGEGGYKGFALGMVLDMLAGGLSGGQCPPAEDSAPMSNNVMMLLWDAARFAGTDHFVSQADNLLYYVRSTRRKPGVESIRLPGDRGHATRRQRADGVPLDGGTWASLRGLANELGVEPPLA